MPVDTWTGFLVVQTIVILTLALLFAVWRTIKTSKINKLLHDECVSLKETLDSNQVDPDDAWQEWAESRVSALAQDPEADAGVRRAVLEAELGRLDGDLIERVRELIGAPAEAAGSEVTEEIDIDALLAQAAETSDEEAVPEADAEDTESVADALTSARKRLDRLLGRLESDAPEAAELGDELGQLKQELESVQAEVDALRSGANPGEENDELKSLLQQFTRDSRDMLACIQKLEAENKDLRDQLEAQPA